MVAQRTNTGAAIPLQLEGIVFGGGHQLVELLLSIVPRLDPGTPTDRVSESPASAHSRTRAGDLGWVANTSQCTGEVVCSSSERPTSVGISARLRSGTESHRVHLRSFKTP